MRVIFQYQSSNDYRNRKNNATSVRESKIQPWRVAVESEESDKMEIKKIINSVVHHL